MHSGARIMTQRDASPDSKSERANLHVRSAIVVVAAVVWAIGVGVRIRIGAVIRIGAR